MLKDWGTDRCPRRNSFSGPDDTYGTPNPFEDATASVHVVRTGNDRTHVTLHVLGVEAPAGRTFGAHVHQSSCGPAPTAAGGHYQHAGATGNLEDREVWLDFTVNSSGNGHADAVRAWPLDASVLRSVAIHASPTDGTGAAGARLACINLDGHS